MWPFARKYRKKYGVRYCPDCGRKIDITDTWLSTKERVFCRKCNRAVWISKDWADKRYPPYTEEREELLSELIKSEECRREKIRGAIKSVQIATKYCTFCGHPISVASEESHGGPASELQCPNCGDIRFYENVCEKTA